MQKVIYPSDSSSPVPARLLAWLAAAVLLSRLALILYLRTWLGDAGAYEHEAIARSLVAGEGFRFHFFGGDALPTSHQAPAIPLLLAAGYDLFGVGSPWGRLAVQCASALLSALAGAGIGVLAFRWWGRRVMVLAVLGFLVYPAFLYMPTRIQAVNWSVTFLILFLAAFVVLARRPGSWRLALLAGGLGGIAVLGEPILAAPFGLCWLWLGHQAPRRTTLLALAAFVLVLAPWVTRSTLVHGRPTFVKSTFWYVFWQGNHSGASGTDKAKVAPEVARELAWRTGGGRELELLLDRARAQAVSVDESLTSQERQELGALSTEAERVDWFRDRALAELAGNPGHYLAVSARRLGMLLWFDDTNPRSFVLAYRLPYLLLLGLALGGVVLLLRERSLPRGRGAPRHDAGALPAGFGCWAAALAGLFLVHTFIITSARFRLPIEALYLFPAALAVSRLLDRSPWRILGPGPSSPPEP